MKNEYFPEKTDYPDNLDIIKTKKSKQYYNAIESSASAYFDSPKLVKKLFFKRLTEVISLIGNKKYNLTLDAGTGIGIVLPYLSQKSQEIIAIDYSDIVNYAAFMCKKKGIKNVSFQKVDLNKFTSKNKFDLILCLSVLEHIDNPTIIFEKFNEILHEQGTLIVGYPIETNIIKLFRHLESYFRKSINKKIREDSYKKTEEFAGHISDWKKIDQALIQNFNIEKKIDLKFCFIKYYAIRKIHKKTFENNLYET